jgi:hypothetical protein
MSFYNGFYYCQDCGKVLFSLDAVDETKYKTVTNKSHKHHDNFVCLECFVEGVHTNET